MNRSDSQLSVVPVTGTSITQYGEQGDIDEITNRLMSFHPEAQAVGQRGMMAVAQLAVLIGANPLPTSGEIYIWKDWRNNVVIDVGIAYYRRIASEKDTIMWEVEPRKMDNKERGLYGVSEGDIAGVGVGILLSQYERLLELGMPWQEAKKMLCRTGYATVKRDEMFAKKKTRYREKGDAIDAPNGRTWQWVANKRAEKDYYRKVGMVDTTLTDKMRNRTIEQGRQERDKPLMIQETGKTLDELNDDLFGSSNTSDQDYTGVIEHIEDVLDTDLADPLTDKGPEWVVEGNEPAGEPKAEPPPDWIAIANKAASVEAWAKSVFNLPQVTNHFANSRRIVDWHKFVTEGDALKIELNEGLTTIFQIYITNVGDGGAISWAVDNSLDEYRVLVGGNSNPQ